MSIRTKQKKDSGFTIVELLLASTVFSIVLMAALVSFLQIGRLFYKGVSLTAVQNIASQVMGDISDNMQSSSAFQSLSSSGGYNYFCVGSTRYTYTTHSVAGTQASNEAISGATSDYSAGSGNFGLLKDKLAGSSGCAAPCYPLFSCTSGQVVLGNNSVEMLGDQMRLASISFTSASGTTNLYNIKLVVAYGDDSVLSFSDAAHPMCVGNSQNQAFCSVVTQSTAVFKGART